MKFSFGTGLRLDWLRRRTTLARQSAVRHHVMIAKVGVVLVITAVAAVIAVEWTWISTDLWTWLSTDFWTWIRTVPGGTESGSVTIRNLGLVVAGSLALLLALWRTLIARVEADTARRDLVHQRFQRGAEMLSDARVMVRLSGISSLERLAREHPEIIHIEVVQLFCTYLRRFEPPEDKYADRYFTNMVEGRWFEEFASVMQSIGSRGNRQRNLEREEGLELDLMDVNCGHGLHFPKNTDLSSASLVDSNLSQVTLEYADLSDTKAWSVKCGGALLIGSRFTRAVCMASFFYNADLRDVDFSDAQLFGADFILARVSGANFAGCRFQGTNVSGTFFGTFMDSGAPARGLTQQQLDEAEADPKKPPRLDGVMDADTGLPLIWCGRVAR